MNVESPYLRGMTSELIISGKALGYRLWKIRVNSKGNPVLVPLVMNTHSEWNAEENLATCYSGKHRTPEVPAVHCACGFNAWDWYGRSMIKTYGSVISGSIAGYGRMQIHETGWRSEKAEVIAFLRPEYNFLNSKKAMSEIDNLAEIFNVPVFDTREELEEYSLKFAQPVPDSAKPDQGEYPRYQSNTPPDYSKSIWQHLFIRHAGPKMIGIILILIGIMGLMGANQQNSGQSVTAFWIAVTGNLCSRIYLSLCFVFCQTQKNTFR